MAKRTEDLRAYWQEIASKAGIDPAQIAAVEAALGDDAVSKAFRQAFVPTPDHHSTLDTLKGEYDSRMAQYDDWYNNTALPAYQANLSGLEKLRQYESTYGTLDPNYTTSNDANAFGFSNKDELDKYLDDRFRAERAGYVGLSKTLPRLAIDYFKRFGEELDFDEVEKLSVQKGLPPDLAYKEFISPRVEAEQKAAFEAKIKEAEERGAQKVLSTHQLPIDSTPKESSPFFDRTEPAKPAANEMEADRDSRNSFLEGWNTWAADIANKHQS